METMMGVREYAEGYLVELDKIGERLVVQAWNEGHNNLCVIDLLDLLDWVKHNRTGLIQAALDQ